MNRLKKILSAFICFVMVISLFPAISVHGVMKERSENPVSEYENEVVRMVVQVGKNSVEKADAETAGKMIDALKEEIPKT